MYNVLDIAGYIVNKHNDLVPNIDISIVRLQSLLYFVQCQFIKINNEPCFKEKLFTSHAGMNIQEIMDIYMVYGRDFLSNLDYCDGNISDKDKNDIIFVIKFFKNDDTNKLVYLIKHQLPYINAMKKGLYSEIDLDDMREFFRIKLYKVSDIISYLNTRYKERIKGAKLYNLLYFIQAYFIKYTGSPCFQEDININYLSSKISVKHFKSKDSINLKKDACDKIDYVIELLSEKSAKELYEIIKHQYPFISAKEKTKKIYITQFKLDIEDIRHHFYRYDLTYDFRNEIGDIITKIDPYFKEFSFSLVKIPEYESNGTKDYILFFKPQNEIKNEFYLKHTSLNTICDIYIECSKHIHKNILKKIAIEPLYAYNLLN